MRDDGLPEKEGEVMDALAIAVGLYLALPVEHPDEPAEFVTLIHRCQDMLATRGMRYHFPEGWYAETT